MNLIGPTGTTTAAFTYEPYGTATKTGTDDTQYRYTGREDDGMGLMYYRARYYHPRFGRFVSEDPIGLAGGYNVYAYVGGSPTNGTDPTGLYAGDGHYIMTKDAFGKDPCFDPRFIEAVAAGARSFDYGTQGPEWAHAHHMSDGTRSQSKADAEAAYVSHVNDNVAAGTPQGLAAAMHAVQDSTAAGHGDFPAWTGGGWFHWPGWRHFWSDIAPHRDNWQAGVAKSRELIRRWKAIHGCPCAR